MIYRLQGLLIDRHNPYLILGSAYGGAAVCIALIASSGSNVVLLLVFSTLAGVSGAQIGLNAVTPARYPTEIRATAIGWALGIGRVGSILGPVIGGLLLGLGWSPAALLVAAVVPAHHRGHRRACASTMPRSDRQPIGARPPPGAQSLRFALYCPEWSR